MAKYKKKLPAGLLRWQKKQRKEKGYKKYKKPSKWDYSVKGDKGESIEFGSYIPMSQFGK